MIETTAVSARVRPERNVPRGDADCAFDALGDSGTSLGKAKHPASRRVESRPASRVLPRRDPPEAWGRRVPPGNLAGRTRRPIFQPGGTSRTTRAKREFRSFWC